MGCILAHFALNFSHGAGVGLAPLARLEGTMVYADPYSEEYISDADLWQSDGEGQLVAEAHRIATGDSSHPPTVEMIKALVAELANARALWQGALAADGGDIQF